MSDDLKSQIVISKKPLLGAEEISRQIFTILGHRVMFRVTEDEFEGLRSQIVTSKRGRGGRRYLPNVFTEQGVAMLSGILNSPRAVQVNIAIMSAFVWMRQMLVSHEELARKLDALEIKGRV